MEDTGTEDHGHHEEEGNAGVERAIDDSEEMGLTDSADEG